MTNTIEQLKTALSLSGLDDQTIQVIGGLIEKLPTTDDAENDLKQLIMLAPSLRAVFENAFGVAKPAALQEILKNNPAQFVERFFAAISNEQQTGENESQSDQTFDDLKNDSIVGSEEKRERIFSAEYDRNEPARVFLTHIKNKVFTTSFVFSHILSDERFFELMDQVNDLAPDEQLDKLDDLYAEEALKTVTGVEGYFIPDGQTWRDAVPADDLAKAFGKLMFVRFNQRDEPKEEGELYRPFAPVIMDVFFYDNAGVEVGREIRFKPITRRQRKEFKAIQEKKPNPDALASHAKKSTIERIFALAKDMLHSADYSVPAWHLTVTALRHLQYEFESRGKF